MLTQNLLYPYKSRVKTFLILSILWISNSILYAEVSNSTCEDAISLEIGSQIGDNTCAADGLVWYFYQANEAAAIQIELIGGTLANPSLYAWALDCDIPIDINLSPNTFISVCLEVGERIFWQLGNDVGDIGVFDINVSIVSNSNTLIIPGEGSTVNNENPGASSSFNTCINVNFNLSAEQEADPMGTLWQYNWLSPTGETFNGVSFSHVPSPEDQGIWNLELVDENGCISNQEFEIIVREPLEPVIDIEQACLGGNIVMNIANEIMEATWTPPNGLPPTTSNENTFLIFPATAEMEGIWNVNVTDRFGCISETDVEIFLSEIPSITFEIQDSTICEGQDFQIVASTDGIAWEWGGPQGPLPSTINTLTIQNISLIDIGSYFVTVTNAAGCTIEESINLANFEYSLIPVNDDCGSSVEPEGLYSTACAGGSSMFCGGMDHVVYFNYTVEEQARVEITARPDSFVGEPAQELWIDVWEDCSGNPYNGNAEGCQLDFLSINCARENTSLIIAVGSPSGTDGSFIIEVEETPLNTVANDNCSTAIEIDFENCSQTNVTGNVVNACPELSSLCGTNEFATVWYRINAEQLDYELSFSDISMGTQIGVWLECAGDNAFVQCLDSDSSLSINQQEIFLSVSHSSSSNFNFDVEVRFPPENDLCINAISLGAGTTCCSTSDSAGCNSSFLSVWHRYTPINPNALLEVELVNISALNINMDVFLGDCSQNEPIATCFSGNTINVEVSCSDGNDVYVQVGSLDARSCGQYELSITEVAPTCLDGSDCADPIQLSAVTLDDPMAPDSFGEEVCLTACNENVCSTGACSENTIWFEITTDNLATALSITLSTEDFPVNVELREGSCNGPFILECSVLEDYVLEASPNTQYYLGVGSRNQEVGEFEVCVRTANLEVDACAQNARFEVTRTGEYDGFNIEGPYCPGEIVHFKYTVTYIVDESGEGSNCQWLQGIIPIIGSGWDLEEQPIMDQGPDPEFWKWLEEGGVEYNINTSLFALETNCDGNLELNLGQGLTEGDALPAGWWSVSPGNGFACSNDGDPDNMWGFSPDLLGQPLCDTEIEISFEFDLKVKDLTAVTDCDDPCLNDLKVGMVTFADGQTGCWNLATCAGDIPALFNSYIDCTTLVDMTDTSSGTEICSGEAVELSVEAASDEYLIELQVLSQLNITGQSSNLTFVGGVADLENILTNTTTEEQTIVYQFRSVSLDPNSQCEAAPLEIEVTVLPELTIDNTEPFFVCLNETAELEPIINGGSQGNLSYFWGTGGTSSSITIPVNPGSPPGTYSVNLRVRDDQGCEDEVDLIYIIQNELFFRAEQSDEAMCQDGTIDEFFLTASPPANFEVDDFIYDWQIPDGLAVLEETDNVLILNEELSEIAIYDIVLDVLDQNGCALSTENFTIEIIAAPNIEVLPLGCDSENDIVVQANAVSMEEIRWELFTSTDDIRLAGPEFGASVSFTIQELNIQEEGLVISATFTNGCVFTQILDLEDLSPTIISSNQSSICVEEGEEITLRIQQPEGTEISEVTWFENGQEICNGDFMDCSQVEVTAIFPSAEYCIEGFFSNGCSFDLCSIFEAKQDINIYFPSIFDASSKIVENSKFFVSTNELDLPILEFSIFDRWGNLVFFDTDGVTDDDTFGWNGTFNSEFVNSGVYVYSIKIELDGEPRIFNGNVTFLR